MEPSNDDTSSALVETIADMVGQRFAKEREDLRTIIGVIVTQEIEKREEVLVASVLKKLKAQLRARAGARTQ